jgi:hypothetical protein
MDTALVIGIALIAFSWLERNGWPGHVDPQAASDQQSAVGSQPGNASQPASIAPITDDRLSAPVLGGGGTDRRYQGGGIFDPPFNPVQNAWDLANWVDTIEFGHYAPGVVKVPAQDVGGSMEIT